MFSDTTVPRLSHAATRCVKCGTSAVKWHKPA